ncbi:hypothetical protein J2T07_001869 [Luteibacter jiangsuensis]|uniref:50S ribosomal protein L29 n=1 Tax=Luteibacter jiangsuensis TaxID=637577 RepID=A0ABT9SXG3_9GAMM|nr:hypothetical protein [Luteibacter jiangsuensis]
MEVPDARRLKDLESESARLKGLVAEQFLAIEGMKEIIKKKMIPAARRHAVDVLIRRGLSQREA